MIRYAIRRLADSFARTYTPGLMLSGLLMGVATGKVFGDLRELVDLDLKLIDELFDHCNVFFIVGMIEPSSSLIMNLV